MTPSRGRRRSLATLVAASVVLGVVMGVVWFLVAPTPQFTVAEGGLDYVKDLPSEYVAMDGWFAVLGVVAGVILAGLALRRGRVGPRTVVVTSLAGLLGSAVAWGVGRLLGQDGTSGGAAGRPIGEAVSGALTLNAKGVLLVWPVVSLAVLTFALAWVSRDEAPRPSAEEAAPPEAASVGGDRDLGDLDRG